MQSVVPAMDAPADAAPGGGGGRGGGEGRDVVMAKRASLAACLTCLLCGRLLRDATTISECLHTFCRKCISAEFINKEACCCPTCNIDLGCAPLEKLRVDHSIQFVRSNIFPFKRKKVEDLEVMPPIASPVKRNAGFLDSGRRANVALTRAKYCLWILGHGKTLLHSNLIWRDIVQDVQRRQCCLDARDDNCLARTINEFRVVQKNSDMDQDWLGSSALDAQFTGDSHDTRPEGSQFEEEPALPEQVPVQAEESQSHSPRRDPAHVHVGETASEEADIEIPEIPPVGELTSAQVVEHHVTIETLEELPQLMVVVSMAPVDYRGKCAKQARYSLAKTEKFYEQARSSRDARFWSTEQEDLYTRRLLSRRDFVRKFYLILPGDNGSIESAVPVPATAAPADAAPGGGVCGGGGLGEGEGEDVVMAKRANLAACLTCPLCGRLLRDATTISECLHTFCRKCISAEFINKEACCCPTCNIDLGCAPLEKLRVDHSIQFVRSKIFPFKRKKVEDPEVMSPIASPVKRKERSLSSLTIPAPQVSIQKCLTKRRTKASCLRNFSLHSTLRCGKETTKKVGGWRPLGCQLKLGKDKKSVRSGLKDVNRTKTKSGDPDDGAPASQSKAKEHFTRYGRVSKRTGREKSFMLKSKNRRFEAKQPSKKRRFRVLWFYLLAAFDQRGVSTLPQLPAKFLRIKDVDLPASVIQKYLVQKLNLSSETEVELLCAGKVVSQGMTLHDLADCWLEKGPKGRMRSSVGSPATGFMVTVFYRRPDVPSPPPETESCHG
ncbi:hypothetical protein ABZP36_005604 [Zizania latifolia]